MLGPYASLFRVRGAWAFSASAFVARLPISMMGIGIVLLISRSTGEYALAGAVAGVSAFAGAVFGPLVARLVDRYGQATVLRPFLLLFVAGVTALVLLVRSGAPAWTWFLAAILAGSLPQFGALARARWAALLPAGSARQTAFAFESVIDEVVFVTGPPLVTFLAIAVSPQAGLFVAASFALCGGLALAALRRTEPAIARSDTPHPSHREVLRPGLVVVSLVLLAAGAVFGSIEVIVVAYSDALDHPGWAGGILAGYAGGSLVAGLVYGAVQWKPALATRFWVSCVIFGAASTLLLTVRSLPVLAVVMFFSGLSISPILIGGTALVETLMPPGALTEGLAWVTTGLILGVTIGASLSGPLIDGFGAQHAFLLPTAAGVSTALFALAGRRWLVGRGSVMLAK